MMSHSKQVKEKYAMNKQETEHYVEPFGCDHRVTTGFTSFFLFLFIATQ